MTRIEYISRITKFLLRHAFSVVIMKMLNNTMFSLAAKLEPKYYFVSHKNKLLLRLSIIH